MSGIEFEKNVFHREVFTWRWSGEEPYGGYYYMDHDTAFCEITKHSADEVKTRTRVKLQGQASRTGDAKSNIWLWLNKQDAKALSSLFASIADALDETKVQEE